MRTTIEIQGARENNLQNITLEIPRDKLTVVTGVSGSGKSSLAFDTVYAEGQRRLLASMSTYAKRFIGQLKKPDVDFVNGLSPVVSIDQKTIGFGAPTRIEKAKIALIQFCISPPKTDVSLRGERDETFFVFFCRADGECRDHQ